MVNYSTSALLKRKTLNDYWSIFDGLTKMVSIHTRVTKDCEASKVVMSSVRDLPRYPSNLCKQLSNLDNAILGFATNHIAKVAYHTTNFPPPMLTGDVVFVPAPETIQGREIVTVFIVDQSLGLVKATDHPCFSHTVLQESHMVIKKTSERRIGAGTLFIFVSKKELFLVHEEKPLKQEIVSARGDTFEVDLKLAQKMTALYGMVVPNELLSMADVVSYEITLVETSPISFDTYVERMAGGTIDALMTQVILGVLSNVWNPKESERLCKILGSFINDRTKEGMGIVERLQAVYPQCLHDPYIHGRYPSHMVDLMNYLDMQWQGQIEGCEDGYFECLEGENVDRIMDVLMVGIDILGDALLNRIYILIGRKLDIIGSENFMDSAGRLGFRLKLDSNPKYTIVASIPL